jgi:molybdate transport system substrate-binding protein
MPIISQMAGEQLFVVGHPETLMEGVYGKEALRSLGVSEDLEEYTLYIKQLEQMLDMVRRQHAYGIFFYSTVVGMDDVRVLDLLPETSHHPVEYYAVAIAGENMAEARKFLDYLKSAPSRKVLRSKGFKTD